MNAFLKNIAAAVTLGALAQYPALAATNVPIQVFLVNLSPSAINSVTWTDASGNSQSISTVASGGIVALGAMSVPDSSTPSIGINQTAANGSPINTSFTLSNNCGYETWQMGLALQQTNPSSTNNASSMFSYTSLLANNGKNGWWVETSSEVYTVCLSNNNQFALGSNNGWAGFFNGCAGTYNNENTCNWPEVAAGFANFPSSYGSNMQAVVLGSYVPTGTSYNNTAQPAFYNLGATASAPGLTLSPTGLTTYVGTSVVIPYNGSDFSYWPVTIYYGMDSNSNPQIPLVQPTQNYCTSPGMDSSCYGDQYIYLAEVYLPAAGSEVAPWNAVNVPAYFTNFQDSGNESAYLPPNAANTTINGFAFPSPCWPLFSNGSFVGCNGAPQYYSNSSATTAPAKSYLSDFENVTETFYYLGEIASVF